MGHQLGGLGDDLPQIDGLEGRPALANVVEETVHDIGCSSQLGVGLLQERRELRELLSAGQRFRTGLVA
jgi:hypothetical protein